MKTNSIFTRLALGFCTVMLLCQAAHHAHAAAVVRSWDGGSATSGNWTTAANWQGNVAPVAGDFLYFPAGAARLVNTNNFATNTTFAQIRFIGDNYNIYGNPVILTNGITANSGADANVFRPNIRLGAPTGIGVSGAGSLLTVSGDIDLFGHDLGLGGAGELHCSGQISGRTSVIIGGSGRVVFDGFRANTYAGDTMVQGGILELNKFIIINPGGIRSPRIAVPGNLVVGGGIGPVIGDAVLCQLHSQIASDAEVTVNQTGELNLNGYNNTIQSLRLEGGNVFTGTGTLSVTGSNIFCQRVGSEDTDPDGSFIHGRLELAGAGPKFFTVYNTSSRLTVSAVITGAPNASITKLGNGELLFTSANTYGGPTLISQGTVRVEASNGLGSGTNGVTLDWFDDGFFSERPKLILVSSTISGKVLNLRGGSPLVVAKGLTSAWNGNITLEESSTGSHSLETVDNATLILNGGISGTSRLIKVGTGTLRLAGAVPNTHTNLTYVVDGELTLHKSNAVAIPGPLRIGSGAGAAPIVRAVYPGGGVLMPDQIADSTVVEVRANGQLILEHSERIGSLTGAGAVQLTSELETGFDNISTTFSGAITGASGELSKIGAGALTLSGNSSHSLSRVEAGALLINGIHGGSVNVWAGASLGGSGTVGGHLRMQGGTMNPGVSPGRLTVNGDVQLASAPSVFRFELNGTATTLHDRLVVGGMLNLAGISLEVIPDTAFPPSSQFRIIEKLSGPPVASPFDGLPEGATLNAGGQVFQITYQGGAGNNDVVLTRGASTISFGLPHTTLGLATLMQGPLGSLIVGNIGSSGEDGVFIPLGDAQGWQGQLTALDPGTGQGRLDWEIQGQRGNLPLQPLTRAYMEVINGEIHAFADSSAVGSTAHWVEVFAGEEFLKNTLVPSNAPLFRLLAPFTNPPAMTLRCEGPFPGKPYWHCDISWPQPRRIAVPGADDSPLDGATRVRVRPWPPHGLANAGPPFALQLTAKNIPAIRISDEALLYPPMPADEGLPHRALGPARLEARSGQLVLTNIGSSGQDGVTIEVGGRSSGIGILTAPISLTPNGTVIALEATGTLDGMPDHSMGTAGLRTVGAAVQAMADFTPVGSEMVRVEVFRGSNLVGSATAPAGLVATLASPTGQGGAPSLDAVGWVPPCLLPVIDGIAQTAFEPLPCYFFHFDGLALFTLEGSQPLVGDSLRLLTANDQPRAQSLARLDIRAALMAPNSSVALNVEKLRLPTPQITRIFPQQTRAGEIIEIRGRGFGNDAHDLSVVGSARVAGQDQLTVPFHVLSASDTRILARVGHVPPGTPGGPIQVFRGVGNEGTPQGTSADVEFIQPIRGWRESTPSGSWQDDSVSPPFKLVQVYQPGKIVVTERCFESEPPVQGILCLYLYEWVPNAVVSFNSQVSAALASGSASVDATGVRFLGGGDLLDGAQRLAKVLEAAFAQQAGLIVNVEATRPQEGTVKLTLSLPASFITGGFLNVCIEEGEIVPSVTEVFPLVLTEGDLITINGQGFGDDARDLWVGVKGETDARVVPMRVLRATDTQILARIGPVPPNFLQGTVVVMRGEGHRVRTDPALAVSGTAHQVWANLAGQGASAVSVSLEDHSIHQCYYSTGNVSNPWSLPFLWGEIEPPVLVLPTTWPSPAQVTINAMVHTVVATPLGGNYIIFAGYELTLDLPTGGTPIQCAESIAAALKDAVGEHSFCLGMSLLEIPGGVRMRPYFASAGACIPAVMGWFSVCVRPAPGGVQITQVTGSGNSMTIHGSGFGNDPDALSVTMMDGHRSMPLQVLSASDMQIIARLGNIPPNTTPGPILVSRGAGNRGRIQPFFDEVEFGADVWVWSGRGLTGMTAQNIAPEPTRSETGRRWFFSGPPGNGVLSVALEGDWPNGAIVSIDARAHDSVSDSEYGLNAPTVQLAPGGNPTQSAVFIADVIRSAFWQQVAVPVETAVVPVPNTSRVMLTMSLPDGIIDHGSMAITVSEPLLPAEMSVRMMSRHVEVSWTGLGTLQVAANPAGPWQDATPAPATNPHLQPASNEARFFRLR